ncbi:MAG: signal recognition particle receptor subunit alpha, partial [Marmoricola sp.]
MGAAEYLVIAAVVALVAVGLLVGLLARRRPAKASVPPVPVAPAPAAPGPVAPAPESQVPALERPEGSAGRLVRLRTRLAGSQGALGRGMLALLSRDRLDVDTWEALEDTLLTADVGVGPTTELVGKLRTRLRVEGTGAGEARSVLREELLALVDPTMDRSLAL